MADNTAIINLVKDKLYKSLSYTSQSYEEIINDILLAFKGNTASGISGLTSRWDNISEADIMFIFISILAAHKDILNYMLDYRILETYMSTAKERQSLSRIAHSFGYKIPSYKAARALMTASSIDTLGSTFTISKFTQFIDNNGFAWTYLGDEITGFGLDSNIELFQGSLLSLTLLPENFQNNSHIVGSDSIAIGNNYSSSGCSSLIIEASPDPIIFTEVDNIYTYTGSDINVYELNVDPQGITYIKINPAVDLSDYTGVNITFNYMLTTGNLVTTASTIDEEGFSLSQVAFTAGSNPYTSDQIREGFKNYYASGDSLVTIDDYKNYILNTQKAVPNITKCIVVDKQDDTERHIGSPTMELLDIAIYVLKDSNALLDSTEEAALLDDLSGRSLSAVELWINDGTTEVPNVLTEVPIYVSLQGTVTAETKTSIATYINSKPIGSILTVEELYNILDDFYEKIFIGTSEDPTGTGPVILSYYEYATCDVLNITQV